MMYRTSLVMAAFLVASFFAVAATPVQAASKLDARAMRHKASACSQEANRQKLHFAARRTFMYQCLRA
jgi:psiF repeat